MIADNVLCPPVCNARIPQRSMFVGGGRGKNCMNTKARHAVLQIRVLSRFRYAEVTFRLPVDMHRTAKKTRRCRNIINLGPDGNAAVFSLEAATTNRQKRRLQSSELVPFEDYTVSISGWTHWTTILYVSLYPGRSSCTLHLLPSLCACTRVHAAGRALVCMLLCRINEMCRAL